MWNRISISIQNSINTVYAVVSAAHPQCQRLPISTQTQLLFNSVQYSMKFQSVWLIIYFAYLQLRLSSITGTFCSDYARRLKHKFSLIKHCQRSNKTVIAFQNSQTVEQCADFARQSRGLAFNFGLPSRKRRRMCRRYSNFI